MMDLLRGYTITDHFSDSGGLVNVPAGSGYLGAQPVVILLQVVPSGVSAFLNRLPVTLAISTARRLCSPFDEMEAPLCVMAI